jgi:hypothetical protein
VSTGFLLPQYLLTQALANLAGIRYRVDQMKAFNEAVEARGLLWRIKQTEGSL